jgi:HPt (histidine-containing phosphotransfer) domain-containing protein
MPDNETIIDLDNALKRALGDGAFLNMLFDEFQRMLPEFVIRIGQAIAGKEMVLLSKEAHQLKGSAANLGANEIASAALRLERLARNGSYTEAASVLDDLTLAISRFNAQVARIEWSRLIDG